MCYINTNTDKVTLRFASQITIVCDDIICSKSNQIIGQIIDSDFRRGLFQIKCGNIDFSLAFNTKGCYNSIDILNSNPKIQYEQAMENDE